jgi:hypothetical protein
MGLVAGIGNIKRKSVHVVVFSVQVLEGYGEVLGNLHYKLVLTITI